MFWYIDPSHSQVNFAVKHMMVSTVRGRLGRLAGRLELDPAHPEKASFEITADVTGIDTGDPKRDGHLRSADFFDAERHPELRFAAQDIRLDGDGKVSVDGELTIKGVTKPVAVSGTVTAPMADPYGNERIGLNLTTKIDRTDFGVDWNNPLPSGEPALANDVTILAELQFVKPGGETS